MNSKRVYFALIASVCLLFIGLVFSTYQINTILSKKASELTKLKAKSLALEQEQTSLKKAKKDMAKYKELHEITKSVVPEDKNQAAVVREIVSIADKNNIALASISFPASSLGSSAKTSTSTSASTASAGAAAGNTKTGALSQLQPVKNIAGVYSLTITVTSDSTKPVPYDRFVQFLEEIEHNRRTAQVNTITIEPKKENRNVLSFTLTLNAYIKP